MSIRSIDERELRAENARAQHQNKRRRHLFRKYGTLDPIKIRAMRRAANNGKS